MSSENVVVAVLLAEEDEEEELLVMKREPQARMFSTQTEEGFFNILIECHLKNDEERFRSFFRLNFKQFHYVVSLVREDLTKYGTARVPLPISAEEKVALTLRYLATGETFRSLSFAFRISQSYISGLVKDTLYALCERLVPIFLPKPTKETLSQSAAAFNEKWNFPNCVAAIDGKHVRMFCPAKSGSLFLNYKDYFSIVLLALVDANYKLIAVDVGSYGKEGDSAIFNKSAFGQKLQDSDFYPPDATLPGSNMPLPHVIVGDEAFRLQKHIMKPFNKPSARADNVKAIFNYRLCRARRVSENSFALLSQIWRIYYSHISVQPATADKLILITCCLHNLLRDAFMEEDNKCHYNYDHSHLTPDGTVSFSPSTDLVDSNSSKGFKCVINSPNISTPRGQYRGKILEYDCI